MPRVFLIFVAALVALMAGALFYAARIPVQVEANTAAEPQTIAPPAPIEVVTHPSFAMPDVNGTVRDSSEWDGKNRILNFWATWCGPCKREIPYLKEVEAKFHDNNIAFVSTSIDRAKDHNPCYVAQQIL